MAVADKIEKAILSALEAMEITSANPTHINRLIQVNNIDASEIDEAIEEAIKKSSGTGGRDAKKQKKKLERLDSGNVKELQDMTSKQFGNVKQLATNPFGFIVASFGKRLAKSPIAKAGPAGFIAFLVIEIGKFIKDELYGAGRILDPRFREAIDGQILKFMERKEQQELKQGYKSVITTTLGGARGGSIAGQLGGNFLFPGRIPTNFLDQRIPQPSRDILTDYRGKREEIGNFPGGGRYGGNGRRQ